MGMRFAFLETGTNRDDVTIEAHGRRSLACRPVVVRSGSFKAPTDFQSPVRGLALGTPHSSTACADGSSVSDDGTIG